MKCACVRITRWKIGSKSIGRAPCSFHGGGTQGPNHGCVRVTVGSSVNQMHPKYSFLFYGSSEFSDSPLCVGCSKKTFLRFSEYLTRHPVKVVKNRKSSESIKGDNLKLIGAAVSHRNGTHAIVHFTLVFCSIRLICNLIHVCAKQNFTWHNRNELVFLPCSLGSFMILQLSASLRTAGWASAWVERQEIE